MQVIATKDGHYKHYRYAGAEFDFPEELFKVVNGKRIMPTWMVEATPEAREELEENKRNAPARNKSAALAASGPKRAKRGFAVAPGAEDLV